MACRPGGKGAAQLAGGGRGAPVICPQPSALQRVNGRLRSAPVACWRRARRDLRAALAVLSMAAAAAPDSFGSQKLQALLRYGFSPACPDALCTRHACTALQRLAEPFKTGWVHARGSVALLLRPPGRPEAAVWGLRGSGWMHACMN